ncbi:sentrin-specific protease 1 [Lepisosteus oculatus]|uniref:sentrin-specific protease 1 n=1 Tax=Lepisosteus oculatus TaxID=7918 RepID=UPI0035F51E90
MFNKIREWLGTGIASLRDGDEVAVVAETDEVRDGPRGRKRSLNCVLDGGCTEAEDRAMKKFRMGDLVDTVKLAAEGVRVRGTSVASWVRNNVSPSLRAMLPASPGPPEPPEPTPTPTTSAWRDCEFPVRTPGSLGETFVAPSPALEWKTTFRRALLRNEKLAAGLTDGKTPVSPLPCETHKTNGHSVRAPPACSLKQPPSSPKMDRTLLLGPRTAPRPLSSCAEGGSMANQSYTSMYEKTFPIRVVQSPLRRRGILRYRRSVQHCTAQESVCEEEKEVYRQLLVLVSGGLSQNPGSSMGLRSHRDLTSFLSSTRRLYQRSGCTGEGEEQRSEVPSSPPSPSSPRALSSGGSSTLPSPGAASGDLENPAWPFSNHVSPGASPSQPVPEPPAALQDSSSQDTQSSAQDSDSVIFVKEQQPKREDRMSVPFFHTELWIKELTSVYDSRARERRRHIEEQEALAARLQKQRLSAEGRPGQPPVELHLRVPLEKEVPLAPIVEETKPVREEPEFPELTQSMEEEVTKALRGGSQDEVLSEGFRLTITRKDLQTLSHLNWLNDEVINFYMNMLVERSKRPGLPSVHTFNTFFYPKLRNAGFPAVRRWTKKVDIFSVDILLVPIHLGVHWCLAVVDFRKKSIVYFDSMGGSNDEACRLLLQYLQQESRDKRNKELNTSGWVVQSKKRNEIPQQMNGSDCGMFTCKYADYITKDKPITFTQKHMPYFRRRMVWEILNRKLL